MAADDLTAARERHVRCTPDLCQLTSAPYEEQPCDAASFRDALDASKAAWEHATDLLVFMTRERDAARALADELTTFAQNTARENIMARALADELPDLITRWLMGEGMVIVYRWMTTGWRETMYDEGVAMWSAALAKWESSK